MAANEFEKNVQRSLDDFKLHPSEEVWQKVEERIREKKRRRIIFFIIFFLIGLALGGYGIYNFSNNQKLVSEVRERKLNETVQGTRNKEQEPTTLQKNRSKNNTSKTNAPREMKINKKPPINKVQYDKEVAARSLPENIKGKNRPGVIALKKYKKEQEKQSTNDIAHQNISSNISLNNNQQNLIDTISQKPASTSTGKDIAKNDLVDTVSVISKENKADLSITRVRRTKKQSRATGKLKWGVNFSAGSSVITQNRFSLKARGNSVSDSYNAPGSVTGSGGSSGAAFVNAPSSNRSSFAFKAGLTLKKDLTKRSSLSMSINYAYLADKIKIGTRQNVSPQGNNRITSYYSSVQLKTFTDRFHFIELPIIYDWRITNNARHFISLNAGTSIGYLVSTNAVVYDTISGGIYYHNKDLFNKMHIHLLGGLYYHFSGTKNLEWSIGPQCSFDVNNIFKTDLDTRKYFLYTGIGAVLFFEKQKKK